MAILQIFILHQIAQLPLLPLLLLQQPLRLLPTNHNYNYHHYHYNNYHYNNNNNNNDDYDHDYSSTNNDHDHYSSCSSVVLAPSKPTCIKFGTYSVPDKLEVFYVSGGTDVLLYDTGEISTGDSASPLAPYTSGYHYQCVWIIAPKILSIVLQLQVLEHYGG